MSSMPDPQAGGAKRTPLFDVGERVMATWRGGRKLYPGTIRGVAWDPALPSFVYFVRYDDNDTDSKVLQCNIYNPDGSARDCSPAEKARRAAQLAAAKATCDWSTALRSTLSLEEFHRADAAFAGFQRASDRLAESQRLPQKSLRRRGMLQRVIAEVQEPLVMRDSDPQMLRMMLDSAEVRRKQLLAQARAQLAAWDAFLQFRAEQAVQTEERLASLRVKVAADLAHSLRAKYEPQPELVSAPGDQPKQQEAAAAASIENDAVRGHFDAVPDLKLDPLIQSVKSSQAAVTKSEGPAAEKPLPSEVAKPQSSDGSAEMDRLVVISESDSDWSDGY